MLSSKDYHAHISEVHRTPSVLSDVPPYPNAHLAFQKKAEEDKAREKAEVTEHEQTETGVDVETDRHEPARYKGCFELQPWKTFRYP